MRNTQINITNTVNQIDTVDSILVGGVVRGRVECRMKRPYCATAMKPGSAALAGSSAWSDSHSFVHSDHEAADAAAARTAIAARQLPASIWGRLVVLKALSS